VRSFAVGADLRFPDSIDSIVEGCESALGAIDIVVANAGISSHKPWEQLTLEDWEEALAVNARASFLLAQRTVPTMRDRGFGRVLFVSSVAAFTGGLIGPHYAASKAALAGLVHFYAPRVAAHAVA